jgi:outer membrane protein TolC
MAKDLTQFLDLQSRKHSVSPAQIAMVASCIAISPFASPGVGAQSGVVTGNTADVPAPAETMTAASFPQLKQTIKIFDKGKSYGAEVRRQQTPQTVGASPVEIAPSGPGESRPVESPSDQYIKMERPQLKSLISVNRNVNPFGLDSTFQQSVSLRDVLLTVSGANLNILSSFANLQTQSWFYRNALTDYLPTVNLGFNELGLNSTSSIPIQATAVLPSSLTGASGTTAVTTLATKTVIQTPLTVLNSGFTWKPIQGGHLLYSALYQKHQLKAAKAQLTGDISNVLLATTIDYYDLILNEALLQIRTAAMEISEEQVRRNSTRESHGLATNLDILQAKTQVSRDRQSLLDQQRLRRAASIRLAHDLNLNLGQDLLPTESTLRKVQLISPLLSVNELLNISIDNRPELKRYEELRLAAKKQIMIAGSDLLPTVSLGGNIIGLQSKIGSMFPTYLLNFAVSWKFDGLGLKALTNVESSRWQARHAMLEANQQFLDVMEQARNAYNQSMTTERAIDESTSEVVSAEEELRLARMRLENGLGTNLDVIIAQRDLTQARLDKALALINFNKAQVQLLHDIGLISIDNLSAGRQVSPKR